MDSWLKCRGGTKDEGKFWLCLRISDRLGRSWRGFATAWWPELLGPERSEGTPKETDVGVTIVVVVVKGTWWW